MVRGKNEPGLHWFAAADLGRTVAASFDDARGLGTRLYVYGPEVVTISAAMEAPCCRLPSKRPE